MDSQYSAASGFIDITPQRPIGLAAYRGLRKPVFDHVTDPLEANVVVIRTDDVVVAFVSLDLLYVGAYLRDRIIEGLHGRVAADKILVAASHTHFAPATEESLPVLGSVTPDYLDFVAERVTRLAVGLLNEIGTQVSLDYFEGTASLSVNRRSRIFGISREFPFVGAHVQIRPNISGPRDEAIHVIRCRDRDGKDVAICWSYACHPVGFPILNDVSAEYPGMVRSMLRAAFGNIPIVFWQGFSGNVSPFRMLPGDASDSASAQYGFGAHNLADWINWARRLGQCVLDAAGGKGMPMAGPISTEVRHIALRELGLSSEKRLGSQEIRLGRDLVICGLTAEVAVEYGEVLRRLRSPARVIPVGCVGDVYGYLPVAAMVREGGYESRGFVRRFGLKGRFVPAIDTLVEERLFR